MPGGSAPGAKPPKLDTTGGTDMDHRLSSMSVPPGIDTISR
jgi:hypothetical protein